ncbi:MAG: subclass B3 metallo-beta-lactamase [Chitinophagaceae bacterium]|nr:subclass B3 metallo-beta-lactamase [Chitinophagaceae bacterium]
MTEFRKILRVLCFLILFLPDSHSYAQTATPPTGRDEWSGDYEPFRIAGNLYYVGTYDLACYLVTSNAGHILINTGLAESADMIKSHIEKLGFRFSDIKILLTQQAHWDHVAAMAKIKKLTNAKLMVNEKDAQAIADGGNSDYLFGGKGSIFKPVKPDRLLRDNDVIQLGDTKLTLLHHPGHTKGSSSYFLDTKDEKRSYRVLIANMPTIIADPSGMPGYPDIKNDYVYTFEKMKNLKFDLWVAAHAMQFGLHEKRKPGDPYDPELFSKRGEYLKALSEIETEFAKKTKK